jgi:hypothetical protein
VARTEVVCETLSVGRKGTQNSRVKALIITEYCGLSSLVTPVKYVRHGEAV